MKYDRFIAARISQTQYDELLQEAKTEGKSFSEVLREYIDMGRKAGMSVITLAGSADTPVTSPFINQH